MIQRLRAPALTLLVLTATLIIGTACSRGKDAGLSLPLQNLRVLAKLYGYLRYFHPSDEAARVDWDKLAVFAASKVSGAQDSKSLKAALQEVFGPVAPAMVLYLNGEQPPASPLPSASAHPNLKLTSWQHYGLGTDNPNSVYKSLRLNRPQETQGYATLVQSLNAAALVGRTITLTAWVKALSRDLGSQVQLWLRVDGPSGPSFFDNMKDRPIRDAEWSESSITGPVAAGAQAVSFGAIVRGRGRFLVDGFRLTAADASGRNTPQPIPNGGFEKAETGGRIPESWKITGQGLDIRLQPDDVREGKSALAFSSIIEPFAAPMFMKMAPADGVIDKEIGRGIVCRIPLTLRSDQSGTLPSSDPKDLDRLRAALDALAPASLTARDENVRLGDVVIGWNVFQHFYPYFDTVKIDWDRVLTQTLERAGTDATEEEFLRTLNWMVARLQDGHGGAYHDLQNKTGWPPFKAEWVEGRAVVIASREAGFRRGDIVLSLDGKGASDILREEEEFLSGSPQWKRARAMSLFGAGAIGQKSRVSIRRGGRNVEAEFERKAQEPPFPPPARPPIDRLGREVCYVDLSRASWPEIGARIQELAAARGVVFDLRGYPNGNHMVLSHLLSAPDTSSGWMKIPNVVLPDREGWTYHEVGWNLPVASPHLGGRVVFLTDGRAISYAESVMGLVEHYELGEIVGEPTAGANGNVNTFSLPGGFTIAWTGMKVVKHDGSQHHTVGVKPTIPFHRTIAGVAAGKDEFLEKALEVINQK